MLMPKVKMGEMARCDRCGYSGTIGAMGTVGKWGSSGLCPLCGGRMRVINYSQSFVVKKGWRLLKA